MILSLNNAAKLLTEIPQQPLAGVRFKKVCNSVGKKKKTKKIIQSWSIWIQKGENASYLVGYSFK